METLLSLNPDALNSLTSKEHLTEVTLLLNKCVRNVNNGIRLQNVLWRLSFTGSTIKAPLSDTLRLANAPIPQFIPGSLLPTPSTDSESHVKVFISSPKRQALKDQASVPSLVVVDPTPNPTPHPTPPATPLPTTGENCTHLGPASMFRSEPVDSYSQSSKRPKFKVGACPPSHLRLKDRKSHPKFNIGSSSPSPTQQSDLSPPDGPTSKSSEKPPPNSAPKSNPPPSPPVSKPILPSDATLATLEAALVPKDGGKKTLALVSDDESTDDGEWTTSEDDDDDPPPKPQVNPKVAADAMYTAARNRRNLDPQPSSTTLHSKLSELQYQATLFEKRPLRSYSTESGQQQQQQQPPRKGLLTLLMNPPPEVFPLGHPERIRSEERMQRSQSESINAQASTSNNPPMRIGGLAMGGLTMTRIDPSTTLNVAGTNVIESPDSIGSSRETNCGTAKKARVSPQESHTKSGSTSIPPSLYQRNALTARPPSMTSISSSISRPVVATTTQTVTPRHTAGRSTLSKNDHHSPSPPGLKKPGILKNMPTVLPGRGLRLGPAPSDMEMEDSTDEEEGGTGDVKNDGQLGGISKSLAVRKLEELVGRRPSGEKDKGKGRMEKEMITSTAVDNERMRLEALELQAQFDQVVSPVSPPSATPRPIPSSSGSSNMSERSQIVRPQYPYNLPAPNPPSTPRTTRQLMLRTEMSESLRQNLLWSRHVAKEGAVRRRPVNLARSHSHSDVDADLFPRRKRKTSIPSNLPTVKSLVQLTPRVKNTDPGNLKDEEAEREERRRKFREEKDRMLNGNRSITEIGVGAKATVDSQFHVSGW